MKNKKGISLLFVGLLILVPTIFVNADSSLANIDVELINQNPDPAIAGDIVEIKLAISNTGGTDAKDVIISLEENYPIEFISGQDYVQTISSLGAYSEGDNSATVKFKFKLDKDAMSNSYPLDITYQSGNNAKVSIEIPIELEGDDKLEIKNIDTTTLIPGKETDVTFTLKNAGASSLKDLTFTWENPDDIILPVGGDNTEYIDFLETEEEVLVSYKVIADTNANTGLYKLDLSAKYSNPQTGTKKTMTSYAGMYVGGSTDFDIAYSGLSDNEVTLTIANIGSNPAYSVNVRVPSQSGIKTSGSNSEIIGNLNNGDYTIVGFELNAVGQDSNEVTMEIDYTDTQGNRITIEKEVSMAQLTVAGPADGEVSDKMAARQGRQNPMNQLSTAAGSTFKTIGIWLVIIILLVVGYIKLKPKFIQLRKKRR